MSNSGTRPSKRIPIEETEVFCLFEEVAQWAWLQFQSWNTSIQQTLGSQLARAAESINANLMEGDGRYTSADSLRFFIIARGSARETRLWVRRGIDRGLVDATRGSKIIAKLEKAAKELNLLISFRRSNQGSLKIREEIAEYRDNPESFNPPILQS
jgi:four helix bundle protein